ncbi:hypothetical protein K1719_014335 [Acacia pycnantha]|nr:hypothetical protein K1719_014335 [Acacia pycnantha]
MSKLLNAATVGSGGPVNEIEITEADYCIGQDGKFPSIEFSKDVRDTLVKGMERTLVIKLLGRSITYQDLLSRTQTLWQTRGSYQPVDMEKNFFFTTFALEEDYSKVLTGEPSTIFGAYLTVQPWSLEFDSNTPSVSKLVAWVRIPGLSFQYYHKSALRAIGTLLGEVVKIDYSTESWGRGKYARIAILIDLQNPLIPWIKVYGKAYGVQYEGLPHICFVYGRYGHLQDKCKGGVSYPNKGNKRNWGKEGQSKGSLLSSGSRYNVLFECEDLPAKDTQEVQVDLVETVLPRTGLVKSNGLTSQDLGPGLGPTLGNDGQGRGAANQKGLEIGEKVGIQGDGPNQMAVEKDDSATSRFLSSAYKALETSSSLDSRWQSKGSLLSSGSRYNVLFECEDLPAKDTQEVQVDLVETVLPRTGLVKSNGLTSQDLGPGTESLEVAQTHVRQGSNRLKSNGAKQTQVYRKKTGESSVSCSPITGLGPTLGNDGQGRGAANQKGLKIGEKDDLCAIPERQGEVLQGKENQPPIASGKSLPNHGVKLQTNIMRNLKVRKNQLGKSRSKDAVAIIREELEGTKVLEVVSVCDPEIAPLTRGNDEDTSGSGMAV